MGSSGFTHPQFLGTRFNWWRRLVLAAIMLLPASSAHAATVSWGQMLCDFAQQNAAWAILVSWFAYITGTYFVLRALLFLKQHTEDPGRNPMNKVWLHGWVGAACLVFPSACQMVINTLFGTAGVAPGGGVYVCSPGAVPPPGGSALGLDILAQNFVNNITGPAFFLGGLICYGLGAFFIFRGLNKLSKYNTDPRAYSPPIIAANFMVGAFLMVLGRTKDLLMASIFGIGPDQLTFATVGSGTIDWGALGIVAADAIAFDRAFIAATTFFQVVGFIAFIRGFLLAKAVVEGSGNHTMGQALTHVIGGVLCMNIILFLRAAEVTFGINFLT
jgi:hypothetical protein